MVVRWFKGRGFGGKKETINLRVTCLTFFANMDTRDPLQRIEKWYERTSYSEQIVYQRNYQYGDYAEATDIHATISPDAWWPVYWKLPTCRYGVLRARGTYSWWYRFGEKSFIIQASYVVEIFQHVIPSWLELLVFVRQCLIIRVNDTPSVLAFCHLACFCYSMNHMNCKRIIEITKLTQKLTAPEESTDLDVCLKRSLLLSLTFTIASDGAIWTVLTDFVHQVLDQMARQEVAKAVKSASGVISVNKVRNTSIQELPISALGTKNYTRNIRCNPQVSGNVSAACSLLTPTAQMAFRWIPNIETPLQEIYLPILTTTPFLCQLEILPITHTGSGM